MFSANGYRVTFEACRNGRKGLYEYPSPLLIFDTTCPKPFEDVQPPNDERVKRMNEMAANGLAIKNPLACSADYSRMEQVAAGVKKK
jgi:hypothetical protein